MDLFRRHTFLLIMMSLLGLAACSDDIQEQPSGGDGTTKVHMRITPYGSSSRTRWADSENAKDDEMMNLWTVVVVDNADNKVKSVRAANPATGDKQELDDLALEVGNVQRDREAVVGRDSFDRRDDDERGLSGHFFSPFLYCLV